MYSNLRAVQKDPPLNDFDGRSGLEIRVCVRTYRLFFVSDTEDILAQNISADEIAKATARAQKRLEKGRRWLERFEKTGKIKA